VLQRAAPLKLLFPSWQ